MLSTSLGNAEPLVLLPSPPFIPSALEGSAGLSCPGFQAGRHTEESSHALTLYTLLQRLPLFGMILFHPDKLVKEVVLTHTQNSL